MQDYAANSTQGQSEMDGLPPEGQQASAPCARLQLLGGAAAAAPPSLPTAPSAHTPAGRSPTAPPSVAAPRSPAGLAPRTTHPPPAVAGTGGDTLGEGEEAGLPRPQVGQAALCAGPNGERRGAGRKAGSRRAAPTLRCMCTRYSPAPALPSCTTFATRSYLLGAGWLSGPAAAAGRTWRGEARRRGGRRRRTQCQRPAGPQAAPPCAPPPRLVRARPAQGAPLGTGMHPASSRFLTGKLTMVGFFSTKNWFLRKRRTCSTMKRGRRVTRKRRRPAQGTGRAGVLSQEAGAGG